MLKRSLAVALFTVPILAQANAVPGLDILMYEMTDLAYYGRRGPAYPNGEAGFMVGHSWCNTGTVNLPWQSSQGGLMVDQYPRIAFLLARESNGRMVQVCGQGHSKHSPTAFNFQTGPCLPCTAAGGSFFYVGCSDTYGSGINGSQFWLGPNSELNPWLGTWNPQGSYFDRGDPPVAGPAAIDSQRSLSSTQVQAFDPVKNRLTVRENEIIAGATYYAQVQAVVQGEPVANRGNNISNRQVTISGGAGGFTTGTAGIDQSGSVLTRWTGATTSLGGNGADDGRFLIAVKVTGPTAGLWHYEYAIHNIDNFRGGASLRLPLAPGATVQNAGFRDLDNDPLNDWTIAQTATGLSFTAVGSNSLDWNTIYNCWFDCSIPPGAGPARIDQARPGAGALDVTVNSTVPSGLAFASRQSVGTPCGICAASFYQLFPSTTAFDLGGRSMTMALQNGAYSVTDTGATFVPVSGTNLAFALNTTTNVTLPFPLPYPGGTANSLRVASSGYVTPNLSLPSQFSASNSLFLSGPARWAAAWSAYNPVASSANNVWFDANANRAILTWNAVPLVGQTAPNTFQIQFFPNGTVHVVWQTIGTSGFQLLTGWSAGGTQQDPGSRDLSATLTTPLSLCTQPINGVTLEASALPVLGTTLQWQMNGIPANTGFGALMRSVAQALPPIDLTSSGMPGCFAHLQNPIATFFVNPPTSLQIPETIPTNPALAGVTLVGQALTYNPPLTPLGLVASNGVVLTLGL